MSSGQPGRRLRHDDAELPFASYMDTRLHFEKVLVLWGDGGRGKTPIAECIANYLAVSYGTNRYIRASTPDALRIAKDNFDKLVPVILEDMSASDGSQHGKKLSANYLKSLFNVRDGGQCRVRHVNVNFHPLMPRILCINDEPETWLTAVEGIQDTDEVPLKKRLFFVHVNELVLCKRAVEAHEGELDALVQSGKRRRLEQNYGEDASTTAGDSGDSTPASSAGSGPPAR